MERVGWGESGSEARARRLDGALRASRTGAGGRDAGAPVGRGGRSACDRDLCGATGVGALWASERTLRRGWPRRAEARTCLLLVCALAICSQWAGGVAGASSEQQRLRRQQPEPETTSAGQPTTVAPAASSPEEASPSQGRSRSKIPAVNFTLVDELFNAVLDESEVVGRWRQMDRQLVDGVRAILKLVFPQIVAMSSDAKVSGNCSGAILKWILNLRNMRSWAVKSE